MPDRAARAPFTWNDFVALDDEDRRELIDGELVEIEVPTGKHEDIVATRKQRALVSTESRL